MKVPNSYHQVTFYTFKNIPLLQFVFVCASVVTPIFVFFCVFLVSKGYDFFSYVAFVLSLFVLRIFFYSCLGKLCFLIVAFSG